jgi:hypothetical protein
MLDRATNGGGRRYLVAIEEQNLRDCAGRQRRLTSH